MISKLWIPALLLGGLPWQNKVIYLLVSKPLNICFFYITNLFLPSIVPTPTHTPFSLLLLLTAKNRSIPLLVFIPFAICAVWPNCAFHTYIPTPFPIATAVCSITSDFLGREGSLYVTSFTLSQTFKYRCLPMPTPAVHKFSVLVMNPPVLFRETS